MSRTRLIAVRRSGSKQGFTLIELLVVIAIIAILAAILFPVFARARDRARQAGCLSNAKQIANGMLMYAQDWDESYPTVLSNANSSSTYKTWDDAIYPYVKNNQVYICPSSFNGNTRSHMLNAWVAGWTNYSGTGTRSCSMAAINEPANTVLLAEAWVTASKITNRRGNYVMSVNQGGATASSPWGNCKGGTRNASGAWQIKPGVHNGNGYNDVFCDGHAKFVTDDPPVPGGSFRWYP